MAVGDGTVDARTDPPGTGGPLRAQQKAVEAQVRSSAALGCFAVEDTRPERMLQVGRAFVRAWVRLNMAAYGVQVMASPSLHVLQHAAGVLPEDYPDTSRKVFAGGREVLSQAFGIDADRIPAWTFRTGRSPALPDKMRTLRRPVAEVVSRSG